MYTEPYRITCFENEYGTSKIAIPAGESTLMVFFSMETFLVCLFSLLLCPRRLWLLKMLLFCSENFHRGKLPKYKLIIVLVHTAHVTGEEKESDRIMQKTLSVMPFFWLFIYFPCHLRSAPRGRPWNRHSHGAAENTAQHLQSNVLCSSSL